MTTSAFIDQVGPFYLAIGGLVWLSRSHHLRRLLEEVAYWRNIPAKVWGCYIGGYQVIKKWLSYREKPLLGRPLTPEEIDEVTHMARRLAAIVLLEPALNGNYQSVKAHPYPWPRQQR